MDCETRSRTLNCNCKRLIVQSTSTEQGAEPVITYSDSYH